MEEQIKERAYGILEQTLRKDVVLNSCLESKDLMFQYDNNSKSLSGKISIIEEELGTFKYILDTNCGKKREFIIRDVESNYLMEKAVEEVNSFLKLMTQGNSKKNKKLGYNPNKPTNSSEDRARAKEIKTQYHLMVKEWKGAYQRKEEIHKSLYENLISYVKEYEKLVPGLKIPPIKKQKM